MLVKQLSGESDLDDVLRPDEQQAWLEDPSTFGLEPRLTLDPDQVQRLRFHSQFERFKRDGAYDRVTALLCLYVNGCVPVARRTELSFWNVSCLPATNRSHHPRWAAVSVGEMEMFVVGWLPETREPWAFVNLSLTASDPTVITRLERCGVISERRFYRAAGADDLQLSTGANTFDAMTRALQEPNVTRAARELSLNVMRKRPNWYAKYHCFDLADAILARRDIAQSGPSGG